MQHVPNHSQHDIVAIGAIDKTFCFVLTSQSTIRIKRVQHSYDENSNYEYIQSKLQPHIWSQLPFFFGLKKKIFFRYFQKQVKKRKITVVESSIGKKTWVYKSTWSITTNSSRLKCCLCFVSLLELVLLIESVGDINICSVEGMLRLLVKVFELL